MNPLRLFHRTAVARASLALGLALLALSAACRPSQPEIASRVFFTTPADGASVSSPVRVTMGAENFTLMPAGEVQAGAGHLHIMVDAECVPAGQVVPKDETHLHFGQGQVEAELALGPGPHRLCLQAADGAHTALADDGLRQIININVE